MSWRTEATTRSLALLFCIFVLCTAAHAQAHRILPPRLWLADTPVPAISAAPIPKEDLLMTDNPADPGASAVILERNVYSDDKERFQTEFFRIKILKEDGTKYADVTIPYLAKESSVEDIRGRTVRSDGSVIEFNGTIYENVIVKTKRLRYQAKTFTLPGAEPGAIVEYSYTMRWKYKYPDYVAHPGGYIFDTGWTLSSTTWTIQGRVFTRHATFQLRPVPGGTIRWTAVRLTQGSPVFVDKTVKLEVSNVPALPEEESMPPEKMLNSRVHLYYEIGWAGNRWISYGKKWEEALQKFLSPTSSLVRIANEIAPPNLPPEERLHKLYSRVKQLRFMSDEPAKTEKELKAIADNNSAEDILRHGYAFGNEANLLFTALARAAEFNAFVVQVADRRLDRFDPGIPDTDQLNAMVVLVRLGDKELYFDPASHFSPYGQLPWYETDTRGVAWSKNGGFTVLVPSQPADKAVTERIADLVLRADGSIAGDVEIVFHGQEAMERRDDAAGKNSFERNKQVEDEVKRLLPAGTEVESITVTGWDAADEPLRIKCHISVPCYAIVGAQRILFSTAVFQSQNRASFNSRLRTQPVYYQHNWEDKDRVTIALPDKYRLEALPEDFTTASTFSRCELKRSSDKGKVVVDRHEVFSGYYFPPSLFGTLWTYRASVRRRDAEKVVLHVAE